MPIPSNYALVQELLTFADLKGLGSSPESVRSAMSRLYGKKPDGISLNSETYFDAVKPPITERYGYACYKILGDFTYTKTDITDLPSSIISSTYAINEGDEEATVDVTVSGSYGETTSWSSSITAGITWTSKLSLATVFEMGGSISVSATVGYSESTTTEKGVSVTAHVPVPARSKRLVSVVAMMKKQTQHFRAPIGVRGYFGGNFPDPVGDLHAYFQFPIAHQVLDNTQGEISGTITNAHSFNTDIRYGRSEPLDS